MGTQSIEQTCKELRTLAVEIENGTVTLIASHCKLGKQEITAIAEVRSYVPNGRKTLTITVQTNPRPRNPHASVSMS